MEAGFQEIRLDALLRGHGCRAQCQLQQELPLDRGMGLQVQLLGPVLVPDRMLLRQDYIAGVGLHLNGGQFHCVRARVLSWLS